MGIFDSIGKVIGITEDDGFDEPITQEEIAAEKARMREEEMASAPSKPAPSVRSVNLKADAHYESVAPIIARGSQPAKNLSVNGSGPFKMIVIEPKQFDECTKLVDNLKSRKPVIINLEKVETDLARKMFDFMSGATYALNGNVQKVTSNIFIFAPANVDIAAKVNAQTQAEPGTPGETKSPWGAK